MARKRDSRKVGAKRMWIRRWLKAGKISKAKAKRLTQHLEETGILLGPAKVARPTASTQSHPTAQVAPTGPLITVQYDPSQFRIEFTAIRRGRRPKADKR